MLPFLAQDIQGAFLKKSKQGTLCPSLPSPSAWPGTMVAFSRLLTQGIVIPGTMAGHSPFQPGKLSVHPQPSGWGRLASHSDPSVWQQWPGFLLWMHRGWGGAVCTRRRQAGACRSSRINQMISRHWSFLLSSWCGSWKGGCCAAPGPGWGPAGWGDTSYRPGSLCQALCIHGYVSSPQPTMHTGITPFYSCAKQGSER